jgi:hypothetical protein
METDSLFSGHLGTIILLIGILVVFVLPYGYHVDLGPGPNGLMAILWELPEGYGLMLLSALEYFIYYLYRLVVLNGIWKFSLGRMKARRLLAHGLISELIPVLISIPGVLILSPERENYIPIMIPLPFLLLYCAVLVLFVSKRGEANRNTQSHQEESG